MSRKNQDPWVRIVNVSDPILHKKGFTLYKVTSKVFPKNSVEAVSEVTVWKRYNDFKKLYKALHTTHQNLHLKGTFPTFAKARFFGRFDESVIEERRQSALELLQFANNYPPLFTSQVFVKFFEDGYSVDGCLPSSKEKEEENLDCILPEKCSVQPLSKLSVLTDRSPENNTNDSKNTLGGTWKHRQIPDSISLSSQCTEDTEDDRTTFTDDDSIIQRQSFDLSEFDPLLDSNNINYQSSISDNWLLSALQSCSSQIGEKDAENVLDFPVPFDDLEYGEIATPSNEYPFSTKTDDDSIIQRQSFDLSEFDPLLDSNNINYQSSISDNWLLSALQSCSSQIGEKDAENVLDFPVPFDDLEYGEIATPSNEYPFSTKTDSNEDTHFSFDVASPAQKKLYNISEFDPLSNQNTDVQDTDDKFYDCDDFATTPTALKNENKSQPSYILHASKYVIAAQEAEVQENYVEAFENYKKAIDVLLQGNQIEDNNQELKDAVRKKILLYLMRAEEIYENKLPKKNGEKFKENVEFCINPADKISSLKGCIQDLNKYKVLGVLGKVLLVLDISSNITYVVKTLYKSSIPKAFDVPHIVPQNIPFMVKLYHIYETSYAIFLILEHASGGRLWDYVSSYLQRSPLSPSNDGACLYLEPKVDHCNVYSGKKMSSKDKIDNQENKTSVDSDLTPSANCPPSYVALFNKYAAAMNEDDHVALAKYKKSTNVPLTDSEANLIDEVAFSQNKNISNLQSNCDNKREKDEISRNLKGQHKNSRNRLSSSTGSLETAISQKTCLLDAFCAMDEAAFNSSTRPSHLPESCVYLWAAEIVVALESLHNLGIIWMDLHPDNILLGAEGHILLTYQSKWNNVDFFVKESAKDDFFCAPEVGNIFPVAADCDWWSLGALLFELLTGRSLVSCHPTGITRHTVLNFPSDISADAKDFVTKLLEYNSSERLGSGIYGVEELKSHPFFRSVDWDSLYHS